MGKSKSTWVDGEKELWQTVVCHSSFLIFPLEGGRAPDRGRRLKSAGRFRLLGLFQSRLGCLDDQGGSALLATGGADRDDQRGGSLLALERGDPANQQLRRRFVALAGANADGKLGGRLGAETLPGGDLDRLGLITGGTATGCLDDQGGGALLATGGADRADQRGGSLLALERGDPANQQLRRRLVALAGANADGKLGGRLGAETLLGYLDRGLVSFSFICKSGDSQTQEKGHDRSQCNTFTHYVSSIWLIYYV